MGGQVVLPGGHKQWKVLVGQWEVGHGEDAGVGHSSRLQPLSTVVTISCRTAASLKPKGRWVCVAARSSSTLVHTK